MWMRTRDGEPEYNINFSRDDLRSMAGNDNLTDDQCDELADELDCQLFEFVQQVAEELDLYDEEEE